MSVILSRREKVEVARGELLQALVRNLLSQVLLALRVDLHWLLHELLHLRGGRIVHLLWNHHGLRKVYLILHKHRLHDVGRSIILLLRHERHLGLALVRLRHKILLHNLLVHRLPSLVDHICIRVSR